MVYVSLIAVRLMRRKNRILLCSEHTLSRNQNTEHNKRGRSSAQTFRFQCTCRTMVYILLYILRSTFNVSNCQVLSNAGRIYSVIQIPMCVWCIWLFEHTHTQNELRKLRNLCVNRFYMMISIASYAHHRSVQCVESKCKCCSYNYTTMYVWETHTQTVILPLHCIF